MTTTTTTNTATTTTVSLRNKLRATATSVLSTIGIDDKAINAVASAGGDAQNFVSEGVTTTAYLIGSVTRSASTLATATRMGAEATYNALPSDREAVEQGINDLIASAKLAMTDLNEMDTETKPKFGTKQSVTEQADNGIS